MPLLMFSALAKICFTFAFVLAASGHAEVLKSVAAFSTEAKSLIVRDVEEDGSVSFLLCQLDEAALEMTSQEVEYELNHQAQRGSKLFHFCAAPRTSWIQPGEAGSDGVFNKAFASALTMYTKIFRAEKLNDTAYPSTLLEAALGGPVNSVFAKVIHTADLSEARAFREDSMESRWSAMSEIDFKIFYESLHMAMLETSIRLGH